MPWEIRIVNETDGCGLGARQAVVDWVAAALPGVELRASRCRRRRFWQPSLPRFGTRFPGQSWKVFTRKRTSPSSSTAPMSAKSVACTRMSEGRATRCRCSRACVYQSDGPSSVRRIVPVSICQLTSLASGGPSVIIATVLSGKWKKRIEPGPWSTAARSPQRRTLSASWMPSDND